MDYIKNLKKSSDVGKDNSPNINSALDETDATDLMETKQCFEDVKACEKENKESAPTNKQNLPNYEIMSEITLSAVNLREIMI